MSFFISEEIKDMVKIENNFDFYLLVENKNLKIPVNIIKITSKKSSQLITCESNIEFFKHLIDKESVISFNMSEDVKNKIDKRSISILRKDNKYKIKFKLGNQVINK